MEKRTKRRFSAEFRAVVVQLGLEGGRSVTDVARDYDLGPSLVAGWVKRAKIDRGHGAPEALTGGEREELVAARKANRELRRDVDFLKNGGLGRQPRPMRFAAIDRQASDYPMH